MESINAYRSPGLPKGYFRQIGSAHVHLDSLHRDLVMEVIKRHEKKGYKCKLNVVHDAIGGPERELFKDTYASHTPSLVVGGQEALDCFSTTRVKDRADAIRLINDTNQLLVYGSGTVIEAEQVIGWFADGDFREVPGFIQIKRIEEGETEISPSPTLDVEIHQRFDLPKSLKTQIALGSLKEFLLNEQISFGGFFLFDTGDSWAYRSNSFMNFTDDLFRAEEERRKLKEFLSKSGFRKVSVETEIEKIIGVWHK